MRLHFPIGIAGFEAFHDYELIDVEGSGFQRLRSTKSGGPEFAVVDPRLFFADYNPVAGFDLRVIVNKHDESLTANLLAPIVIHADGTAEQRFLNNTKWPVRCTLTPVEV